MKPVVAKAYQRELQLASAAKARGELALSFTHLQRAHVLGQRHVVPHMKVHAAMLALDLRRRDLRAAWGQLVRIVLGALGSMVGRVPLGNTGGSDISMFAELPIEPDLAELRGIEYPSGIILPMRRFLAALLLALLPVQFAFAVAANYCDDAGKCSTSHFGHHECGKASSPAKSDDSKKSGHDCGICHLSHAQAFPTPDAGPSPFLAAPRHWTRQSAPPGRSPEPLERPPRAALA